MSSSESDDVDSHWGLEGTLPTPLHAAAVNGNKPLLQSLLQEGDKSLINKGDQFGRTPLVYSVLGDRLDCTELLLKAGANVSSCDVDGRTPLHWAAYQGNLKCVKLLLSKGANWKVKDIEGRTPLHFATSHQSSKCLSSLLKRVPKGETDEPDNDLMTSLHWSASYGNVEHVKLLLKAGAQVKLTDLENKTPLHWAATNPDPAVVKLLLDCNADIINLQDNEGRTALHLAVARQNEAVVKVLIFVDRCNVSLQDNMNRSPLHWAAVLGNSQLVRLLLQRNADFKAADSNGATALHYVAQSNFSETVKVFLSCDRVEDVPDNEGRTALMWAAGKGAESALRTMLEHGLDVNTKDKTGGTALHAAAYSGHANCVKLLIEYSACVDSVDRLLHTPLYRACEMGHSEAVNILIQNGASVNLEDQDGRSPLHWAALGGHSVICLTLIQHGLAPDSKDHLGRTPLQCSAYGGFVSCIVVLIEHEAYVNHQDKEGITALHWSCSSGHLEAVKMLLRHMAFPNFREFDGERLTPLDYAIIGDHQDVAQFMIEQGALTINGIQDIAATTIQSCWRGYQVRKSYQNRKNLLMRHEQLKDMKKRASAAEQRRTRDLSATQSPFVRSSRDQSDASGGDSVTFLGDVSNQEQRETQEPFKGNESLKSSVDESSNNLSSDGSGTQQIPSRLSEPSEETSSESVDSTSTHGTAENLHLCTENCQQADRASLEVTPPISSIVDTGSGVDEPLFECKNSSDVLPKERSDNVKDRCNSKPEIARRERERLHLIRTKVNAAATIQRWFRKRKVIKHECLTHDLMMSDLRKEQEELNKELAALTIQLAWRKHVRVEFEKDRSRTTKKNVQEETSTSPSYKPKQKDTRFCVSTMQLQNFPNIKSVNPRASRKRRPASTKHVASPAAMSYNMAKDLYHPMGSRQGNSRAAMVTGGGTRVRPGSMTRAASGWSCDVNFALKTHGHKPGSKDQR